MKVLHVSAELIFGGVENWLLNVARLRSSGDLRMDIAVTGNIEARVQAKFEKLDVRVFACPSTYDPLRTARNLYRILGEQGPYDVLHSHMHRGNAHVGMVGRMAGVPAIVVHSHVDSRVEDARQGWRTKSKAPLAALLQRMSADMGLACGEGAGDCLFDRGWRERSNWSVLHCGLDLAPFERTVDRAAFRREFGIPANAYIIGHIGRFAPEKNQAFLLDLAARYSAINTDAYFVLAGDGELLAGLERRVRAEGLSDRIRFLGARDDVPELALGLFDVFLLPSLMEGLPLAFLEAQAAGLPALVSDRVPRDGRVLSDVEALGLDEPLEEWCAALDRLRGKRVDAGYAVRQMRSAGFGVEESAQRLESYYRGLLETGPVRKRLRQASKRSVL